MMQPQVVNMDQNNAEMRNAILVSHGQYKNMIDKRNWYSKPEMLQAALFIGCSIRIFFWFSLNLDCILGPLIETSITQSKEDASLRVKVVFLL